MRKLKIKGKLKRVEGVLRVPSDKSISHRAVILGAIASGETVVHNWLEAADTKSTLRIVRSLGTKAHYSKGLLRIKGRNYTFEEPQDILNAGNSGTTARLILGVLSTQPFFSVLTGDRSLRERPMLRVVSPLREMGAYIEGRERGNKLPAGIKGGKLKAISFFNKKSSAQVKSALLLAGIKAEGITEVTEPLLSRDHTERMLKFFGADLIEIPSEKGRTVKVKPTDQLVGREIFCPADPSSAAFFCALTLLAPKGEIILKDVLINPTRDGFYRKIREMGGEITYENEREFSGEPVADIKVIAGKRLKAVKIKPYEIPTLIDEIPILAVIMALAEGISEVRGAAELRVKESDRIKAIVENLKTMGVRVEELEDGFLIEGGRKLRGGYIRTYGDHRIAMAFTVAGLLAEGETVIDNPLCVEISYPRFFEDLKEVVDNFTKLLTF